MVMTASGREALTLVHSEDPALVVLDLMLPDLDGMEVCRRIRETSTLPVLMLTARDDDLDKIAGLEAGADDYLTKPFNPRELVARVRAILRRSGKPSAAGEGRDPPARRARARRRPTRVPRRRRRDSPRAEGVRSPVGAPRPQGPRPHARPAARAGVGLHVRRRHPDGRRSRPSAEAEARRCRRRSSPCGGSATRPARRLPKPAEAARVQVSALPAARAVRGRRSCSPASSRR